MNIVEQKWDEILETMRVEYELSPIVFDTWLKKPLKVGNVTDNKIEIIVDLDSQSLAYIKKRYYNPLNVTIASILGKEYELEFILANNYKPVSDVKLNKDVIVNDKEHDNLNPNYTFDKFVVGANNRFAHAASLAVAESPGEVYNPLFIYGGVGLGKTHLIQSIAHYIKDNNPSLKVLYVSSEKFTNDLIDAIRNNKNNNSSAMNKFREKYRNVDVLIIDDIQFIIGKEGTQEEFFHTFNELYIQNKAIIISSDRQPKEMETLEERIRSRFDQGLLADISIPDFETRAAILRKKQEADNIHIDDEIINYIAMNIKSNVRELEGALNKLIAYSNLEGKEITMEIAEKELANIISPDKPKKLTPQIIIEVVADHFQISLEQMIGKSRTNNIAFPRQIAMYLCKTMTSDYSLDAIGEVLGGRDHSTILHGYNKIEGEISKDENTSQIIETIKKKLSP
ncbi:MAG: chromosomal replication initiator protein DnaA [Lachnospiraceae bacterium]|nr:chromosomal replication initiator protein DnaA [Lachnospiraceae bacterium]MBQ9342116.1 chromosomal replication initiator protein DnaA [Lachnospiraceae bacterium]MCR5344759.1 chromosomal replication initiator protein DnaA [Lachnospiraceae bacterium]